ncbi:GCN5 family N-acetyltransferase [Marichromatium purpuratum 984]|uniref:GCN5 family N-acetyltransferase n=1 Tax=Marichromatium purpuratum 984 TaxID=765910 RepID=W0E094_MARPU|nr:GNAT family N-acetyltransferase [Marichromatium purpuratum]AHF02943.1 GCN5 family N-acetyltransferase [Marichromatium purpuratum 984]
MAPVLETARLRLRQWHGRDLAPFAALNADPRVMAWLPRPLSRAESTAMAARCRRLIAVQGWGFWAVERRAEGAFLGLVGLHRCGAELPFAPAVEIGWRLAHHAWGQGYAGEAARAALGFGFTRLGLDEIVAFTSLHNQRSLALMARLGMRADPQPFAYPALPPGHRLRAHRLCRLGRADWHGTAASAPERDHRGGIG